MIWVLGSRGMLGKHICEVLNRENLDFIGSDAEIDIRKLESLLDFTKDKSINWIINCAAYTAVDNAEDDYDNAKSINADSVRNIGAVANETGAKVVHFSTDYVFDGEKTGEYVEDDPANPVTVYGKSKLIGEKNLESGTDKYFIFRISWLYGPHGNNFVHTMLRLFRERDELNVVNDQFGSPTYTGEIAEFISRLIKENSNCFGLYHFSGEGRISWYDFARSIYDLAQKTGLVEKDLVINAVDSTCYPAKARRPKNSYMNKNKLFKAFGFKPNDWKVTLEIYMRQIFESKIK